MTQQTFVIGVAGGSGSGKTTVVRRIVESIGDDQVTVLEHDRYYRDRNDLRLEERAALITINSLETDLLVRTSDAARRRDGERTSTTSRATPVNPTPGPSPRAAPSSSEAS